MTFIRKQDVIVLTLDLLYQLTCFWGEFTTTFNKVTKYPRMSKFTQIIDGQVKILLVPKVRVCVKRIKILKLFRNTTGTDSV